MWLPGSTLMGAHKGRPYTDKGAAGPGFSLAETLTKSLVIPAKSLPRTRYGAGIQWLLRRFTDE